MADTVFALQKLVKTPRESKVYAVDFTNLIDQDVTLTGTPTVVIEDGDDVLQVGAPSVNTATFWTEPNGNGQVVEIGKAVQCRLSAGTHGQTYRMAVRCGTTANAADVHEVVILLMVNDGSGV